MFPMSAGVAYGFAGCEGTTIIDKTAEILQKSSKKSANLYIYHHMKFLCPEDKNLLTNLRTDKLTKGHDPL